MNIQIFYVKTEDREALLGIISHRLDAPPDPPGKQPNWGLESSYDKFLANEPKRKVVVSPVDQAWVAVIESKEMLDFGLLQQVSERMGTEVIACQLASAIDSCGYANCRSGRVTEVSPLKEVDDPLETLRAYLRERSVPHDLITFREAVRLRESGWALLQRK